MLNRQNLREPPINFDSWILDTYGPLHASVGANVQQVNFQSRKPLRYALYRFLS